jgi:sialate O-acetylesterase
MHARRGGANRSMITTFLGALCAVAALAAPAQAQGVLDPMFQDHAVLQRGRPIAVWGQAAPRERVSIAFNNRRVSARADADGHWRASLPAMGAGGPYTLTATTRSGETSSAQDVLIGDVWLCSGQSNMEFSVRGALYPEREIARATDASIRLMNIAHAAGPAPLDAFETPVAWAVASPETVRNFSAACYFFARELKRHVDVPMGLINSAWGGANIETWIGAEGLRAAGGFDERLDLLALYAGDANAGYARMGALWENWWRGQAAAGDEPWADATEAGDWFDLPTPMRNWKTWGVEELANHNGMVWFRRVVTLSEEQAAQGAILSLGAIDEVDQTWVNGRPIANTFGWSTERNYELPAGSLRAGDNLIVVNVLSTWDMGGMFGPPESMALKFADGSAAPLGGDWRVRVVPRAYGYAPRAPWESVGGLTSLNNAMIAPLGPYGLRGALWYQGESNTGAAEAYEGLLGALMRDWRGQFGADLPFLIVQLPNFGARPSQPVQSDWASLREAQRRAVAADGNAGLAVTIDVGDPNDLHPPNKQAVGQRLARAARHLIYGEAISASGPIPLSARVENGSVLVRFGDIEGALTAFSARGPIGFELCGADQASCRFVDAAIDGASVRLEDADGEAATRVRYCWGDAPTCTLYDGSGLPAGPFEINIE